MTRKTDASEVALDVDALEREDPREPFDVRLDGRTYLLRDPAELPWDVLRHLSMHPSELLPAVAEHRETFTAALNELPGWKVDALAAQFTKHFQVDTRAAAPPKGSEQ